MKFKGLLALGGCGLIFLIATGCASDLSAWRKKAEQGDAEAQNRLGMAYDLGQDVSQDFTKAAKWYRLAAEQGDAGAQLNLGLLYFSGNGVPQDSKEATRWYRLAADQGLAEAQHILGVCYTYGNGVPQDDKEAVAWFRLAAEQGFAMAQYYLGSAYSIGRGVPQDHSEAVKWSRLAAEQGEARSQFDMGVTYDLGEVVPQDYTEAVKWYRLSAEQGNAEAQCKMGVKCYVGQGVPKDYTEAAKWYRLAAEQGNAAAQFILGSLYYSGDGVPQDYAQGYAWLNISASQGFRESADSLPELIKTMTPEQIEEGEQLSREFRCAGCKSPEEYMDQAQLNAWWSKDAKIEFAKKMKTGDRSPAHDFVSQYDFANAALEDLPWNLHLLCLFGNEFWNYCEYVKETHPDWNYLEFNFPDPEPRRYERIDRTTCRLTDGVFRGELVVSNGTVSAVSGYFADGFEICDIRFTDVNRDGFMDAVLRLVQHGSGSGIVSGTYVLTRKQPDTKFSEVGRRK